MIQRNIHVIIDSLNKLIGAWTAGDLAYYLTLGKRGWINGVPAKCP